MLGVAWRAAASPLPTSRPSSSTTLRPRLRRSRSPRHPSGSTTTSSSRPASRTAAGAAGPTRARGPAGRARRRGCRLRLCRAPHPEPHHPGPQGPPRGGGAGRAEALGFEVERQESREDGSTPGDVLGTRPEAGEELEEGDTLTLIISLGNTPAPVPTDLAGKPLEEATQILAAAGGFAPEVAVEIRDGPEGRRHPARRRRAGRAAEGLGRAVGRVERSCAPHGPVGPGRRHVRPGREPPSEGCS